MEDKKIKDLEKELKDVKSLTREYSKKQEAILSDIKKLLKNIKILEKFIYSKKFIGDGRIIKCKKCSYIWKTKTEKETISCPNCRDVNEVESNLIDIEKLKQSKDL